ncbi:putative Adhesin [Azospirillaceae bacterium]
MSIDPFSQAFALTDWNKVSTVPERPSSTPTASTNASSTKPKPHNNSAATHAEPSRAAEPRAIVASNESLGDPPSSDVDFTFHDALSIINPLQHIPLVDIAYRHITGDTITPSARVMGGILYGGPLGGAVAATIAMLEEATGADAGETLVAAIFGEPDPPNNVVLASAETDSSASAPQVAANSATAPPLPAADASSAAQRSPARITSPQQRNAEVSPPIQLAAATTASSQNPTTDIPTSTITAQPSQSPTTFAPPHPSIRSSFQSPHAAAPTFHPSTSPFMTSPLPPASPTTSVSSAPLVAEANTDAAPPERTATPRGMPVRNADLNWRAMRTPVPARHLTSQAEVAHVRQPVVSPIPQAATPQSQAITSNAPTPLTPPPTSFTANRSLGLANLRAPTSPTAAAIVAPKPATRTQINAPVPPTALPEAMLRNLEKYQQRMMRTTGAPVADPLKVDG